MTTLRGCLCLVIMVLAYALVGCQDQDETSVLPPADTTRIEWAQVADSLGTVVDAFPLSDGGVMAVVRSFRNTLWHVGPDSTSVRSSARPYAEYGAVGPLLRSPDGCLFLPVGSEYGWSGPDTLYCLGDDWTPSWSRVEDSLHPVGPMCPAPGGNYWMGYPLSIRSRAYNHSVAMVDPTGAVVESWTYPFPDDSPPDVFDDVDETVGFLGATPDGGCWMVGITAYDAWDPTTRHKTRITRVNRLGSATWMRRLPFPNNLPLAADVTADGNLILLVGESRSELHCYDPAGNLVWLEQFTDLGADPQAPSLVLLPDQHLLVGVGSTAYEDSSFVARVIELDRDGRRQSEWQLPGYNWVDALVLTTARKLVVFARQVEQDRAVAIRLLRDRP